MNIKHVAHELAGLSINSSAADHGQNRVFFSSNAPTWAVSKVLVDYGLSPYHAIGAYKGTLETSYTLTLPEFYLMLHAPTFVELIADQESFLVTTIGERVVLGTLVFSDVDTPSVPLGRMSFTEKTQDVSEIAEQHEAFTIVYHPDKPAMLLTAATNEETVQ